MNHQKTYIPEITCRGVIIAIVLTVILATANTYLALKVGLLTSASIPAAMIAMGILKFFPNSNILENNQIQTCASAGEAVAGGVVYTLPALIIIQYWQHFDYLTCFLIALIGGSLGVFFSIPLRRLLVNDRKLRFPEGQAIANVLKIQQSDQQQIKPLMIASAIGALVQFGQAGLKIFAAKWQWWVSTRAGIFGGCIGFSATLLGTGYLIGMDICLSIFIGGVVGWLVGVPALSYYFDIHSIQTVVSEQTIMSLWTHKISYIGVGAMLLAGALTLGQLFKPLYQTALMMIRLQRDGKQTTSPNSEQDRDLPWSSVASGLLICLVATLIMFYFYFTPLKTNLLHEHYLSFVIASVVYVAIIGFVFSAICGYFSGLLGVSAAPGSAVLIASMMLAALAIDALLQHYHVTSHTLITLGAAITIIIGSVIMSSAAIAIDNIQDLKVGQLIGATPWKQQLMLLLGVLVASLIIPLVMSLLYQAYGIAGSFPHANMDLSQQLMAPPAAMMAAITQGIFNHQLPTHFLSIGAAVILCFGIVKLWHCHGKRLSLIGIAIGIYLPLATTTPLVIGAILHSRINKHGQQDAQNNRGTLMACGLIAGSAVMDVLLAIPVALSQKPDALNFFPSVWHHFSGPLGVAIFVLMVSWFYRHARAA